MGAWGPQGGGRGAAGTACDGAAARATGRGTTVRVATRSGAGSLVPRAPRRGAPAHRGRARRRAMRVVARPTASVAKTAARLRGKHPITRGLAARIFPGVSRRAARYEIAL